jgi:CDP-diacylglycerol--glycerol-3-phosphate 3-phosphatidyltransferase
MSTGPGWFSGRVARAGEGPVSVGNIANLITVARILVAPVVLWLVVVVDAGDWGMWRFVAAALFIAAISTDGVDGALARKRNLITTSGVLMDPIADKALTGAAFIALALVAELPWWVVVVILGREVLITAFRFAVLSKKVIPASRGGKAKTISQAIALGFWLTPAWIIVGEWIYFVNWALMGVVVVLTVVSGLDYLIRGLLGGKASDADHR